MIKALTKMTMIAALVVAWTPSLAIAQDEEGKAPSPQLPTYALADSIEGLDLHTKGGETIGEVDALIVETGSRRILFAVVSTGGFLGIGDQLTAVPYELMKWSWQEDDLTLQAALTKKNLASAPNYEHDKLGQYALDEAWCKQTAAAFGVSCPVADKKSKDRSETPASKSSARMNAKLPLWQRASEMESVRIETQVKPAAEPAPEPNGKGNHPAPTFGKVEDLVIHLGERKLVAVVVSHSGNEQIMTGRYVIPCAALKHTKKKDCLQVFRTLRDMRDAPRVERDVIARLRNEELRAQIHKFYGVGLED